MRVGRLMIGFGPTLDWPIIEGVHDADPGLAMPSVRPNADQRANEHHQCNH